jgi:hypothetical protein
MVHEGFGELALFANDGDDTCIQEHFQGVQAMMCLPYGIAVTQEDNPRHPHTHQQICPVGCFVQPISVMAKGLQVYAAIGNRPAANFYRDIQLFDRYHGVPPFSVYISG